MKSYIESFARYGALAAICFEWSALLYFYLVRPQDFDGRHTISYFSSLPETRVIFAVCYVLAALSFWLYSTYHLNKHLKTPTKIFALSMICFAAVALVPFDPYDQTSELVHKALALLFSAAFILGIIFIAKNNPHKHLRWVSGFCVGLSALFLAFFMNTSPGSPWLMVFEAGSGVSCQLWMVWVSLHTYKLGRT